MKRALVVLAACAGLCLLGCGGTAAEVEELSEDTRQLSSCPGGEPHIPECAAVADRPCNFPGQTWECCNANFYFTCYCTNQGYWLCP